jgi:hypothetical protein
MVPAHEGLDADDLLGRRADLGLEHQLELTAVHRLAQAGDELEALDRLLVDLVAEEADAILAGALRLVHRRVGVLDQLLRLLSVARVDRDPDAGADPALVAVEVVGLFDLLADRVGDLLHGLFVLDVLDRGEELVAADARDQIAFADRLAQAPCDVGEQLVADAVGPGCR